jgi:ELWxxDGT repeat protein
VSGNVGLWETNGTAAGTSEISVTGAASSGLSPSNFTVFGSEVLFSGADASGHQSLWVTDGTVSGTSEISTVTKLPSGLNPSSLFVATINSLNAFGVAVSATEGASTTATVATFTDANAGAPISDFTATINWGDGTAASPGTVVSNGNGNFTVTGTHTYADEGSHPVMATVSDVGGSSASATGMATVADAALTATAMKVTATEGALTTATVATFTDANAGAIFETGLGILRAYLFAHTTNRIDVELGARLFRHLMALPIAYFQARRVGDSVARVRELENIRNFLTSSAFDADDRPLLYSRLRGGDVSLFPILDLGRACGIPVLYRHLGGSHPDVPPTSR